ncbi:MAG: C1 family peptidase [Alphaproteobacteria bacterium]|nr:C1 family peptidase [Alphaproteobacteria bacterium]
MPKQRKSAKPRTAKLDARPDTVDFRDLVYVPTLVEVPAYRTLDEYCAGFRKYKNYILDQGQEGACTGFGLAAVANYLLATHRVVPDLEPVSPAMLYAMARRYDEWPGETYEGSSARGAMKGWHKHGVCALAQWPYTKGELNGVLDDPRAQDARERPLGAYFRVNSKDIVAIHAAIAEAGIVYATADVHQGWDGVGADGKIVQSSVITGGHAFAIVAYDREGFWIQNSWGSGWGKGGFGHISYDDWMANGNDVWVARLGAPVVLNRGVAAARAGYGTARERYAFADLRKHIISVGNDGKPRPSGVYGTTAQDITTIVDQDLGGWLAAQKKGQRRVLLYAHGGLVDEDGAIQRVADYRQPLLDAGIYPLAFIWKTDAWTTFSNILQDAMRGRRPEGILSDAKDWMLDRLDDTIEPIARRLGGKAQWEEMKENGTLATTDADGAARLAAQRLAVLAEQYDDMEVHIAGHSAGSIFMAPLIELWTRSGTVTFKTAYGRKNDPATGLGQSIASCTMWAPACTMEAFLESYAPAIKSGAIGRFGLVTLDDKTEQEDNCANIYHKSLLYLVAHALEKLAADPHHEHGTPLLGMQLFIDDPRFTAVRALLNSPSCRWALAPNRPEDKPALASRALHHGDFDDDETTLKSTLAFILNPGLSQPSAMAKTPALTFAAGMACRRDWRHRLQR